MTSTRTLTFTAEQLLQLADGLEAIHPHNCTDEEIVIQDKLYARIMKAWRKLQDEGTV